MVGTKTKQNSRRELGSAAQSKIRHLLISTCWICFCRVFLGIFYLCHQKIVIFLYSFLFSLCFEIDDDEFLSCWRYSSKEDIFSFIFFTTALLKRKDRRFVSWQDAEIIVTHSPSLWFRAKVQQTFGSTQISSDTAARNCFSAHHHLTLTHLSVFRLLVLFNFEISLWTLFISSSVLRSCKEECVLKGRHHSPWVAQVNMQNRRQIVRKGLPQNDINFF